MIVCFGAVSEAPLYVPISCPDSPTEPDTLPSEIVACVDITFGIDVDVYKLVESPSLTPKTHPFEYIPATHKKFEAELYDIDIVEQFPLQDLPFIPENADALCIYQYGPLPSALSPVKA